MKYEVVYRSFGLPREYRITTGLARPGSRPVAISKAEMVMEDHFYENEVLCGRMVPTQNPNPKVAGYSVPAREQKIGIVIQGALNNSYNRGLCATEAGRAIFELACKLGNELAQERVTVDFDGFTYVLQAVEETA